MDNDLKQAYNELYMAFKDLPADEKRKELGLKLEEMNFTIQKLIPNADVADEIKADYKTEDEYLEYLFSLIYNLENKLGNLLDSSSDENK